MIWSFTKTKILLFSIVLSLLTIPIIGYSLEHSYSDIEQHWAKAEIENWTEKEIINGYKDGTFKPNDNITRAEFITLINKVINIQEEEEISFEDVDGSEWYYKDLKKAIYGEYIGGYEDKTFRANDNITRQEVAVILQSLVQLQASEESGLEKFTDTEDIPTWSRAALNLAVQKGYLTGYADNSLKASNYITRAESVKVLTNVFGTIYKEAGIYGPGLDEEVLEVKGNVTVSVEDVTLQNMIIDGDLYLAEGIGEGDVTLDNITVTGDTIVKGGGENSIIIKNSSLKNLYVIKKGGSIRILLEDTFVILINTSSPRTIINGNGSVETINANEGSDDSIFTVPNAQVLAFAPVKVNETEVNSGEEVVINNTGTDIVREEEKKTTKTTYFNVTFVDYDETTLKTETVKKGNDATAPVIPDRVGYTFLDWDKEFTNVNSDLIINARWIAKGDVVYRIEHYQQNINDDGYTLFESEILSGTADTKVVANTKPYTGFSENIEHIGRIKEGVILPDGSLTFKLYYDRERYTVTFLDHDGSIIDSQEIKYKGNAITPANPTRIGYTFTGWDGEYTNVTENIEVNGTYEINQYTITFDTDGGTLVESIMQDYQTLVIPPEDPTRIGYTFGGWNEPIPEKMPSSNITIKAIWNPNSYIVNFDDMIEGFGSITIDSIEVTYGTEYGILPAITQTGYNHEGWYTEASFINKIEDNSKVETAENHTLYAKWVPKNYVVTFDSQGGTDLNPLNKIVTYRQPYGDLATVEREGYSFDGWYYSGSTITSTTIVYYAYDHTLKATWSPKDITVTFDAQGGTNLSKQNIVVTYDQLYGDLATIEKIGYTFDGWYTEIIGGTKIESTSTLSIPIDHNLYARWIPNDDTRYSVTHYLQEPDGSTTYIESESFTGTTDTEVTATPKSYADYVENLEHISRVSSGTIKPDGTLNLKFFYNYGIKLDNSTLEISEEDNTRVLYATTGYGVDTNINWSSSDPSIATVEDGKITPLSPGETTITATAGGYSDTCSLTVYKPLMIKSAVAEWGDYSDKGKLIVTLTYDQLSNTNIDKNQPELFMNLNLHLKS
jgi:uncharacterized repeat protein (TIGR02543 family)